MLAQGFLPYFADVIAKGTTTEWFGRSFGAALTGLAYGAYADPESKTVAKMLGIASLCTLPNIYLGITGGAEFDKNLPGTGINIWQAQIVGRGTRRERLSATFATAQADQSRCELDPRQRGRCGHHLV